VRWQQDQADPDYLLDLEIAIPLFDRKKGDVLEARYNLAGVQAEKNAADAASSAAVAEYYFSLLEADARRLTLRDEVLPAARVTFEAYRTALASGMDRLGDLFDSRRNLVRAEAQYTGALVDFHQALAALESIVGRSLALAAEGAE
jgi:cobalt-zinc-cadmium efflux system outer membrane protein